MMNGKEVGMRMKKGMGVAGVIAGCENATNRTA
jgi:hypothetical protein